MNIKYKVLQLKNGEKILIPVVNEENGETFAMFLDCDVRPFKSDYKKGIESVITGERTEFSFGGNACELNIKTML